MFHVSFPFGEIEAVLAGVIVISITALSGCEIILDKTEKVRAKFHRLKARHKKRPNGKASPP